MKHNIVYSFLLLLLIGSVAVGAFVFQKQQAHASTGTITGYAWSDMPDGSDSSLPANASNPLSGRGFGWISMSCQNDSSCGTSNYGVSEDSTGLLSGYAWSSNAGWISFNGADLSGCPSGGSTCKAQVNLSTGEVTGWARALEPLNESSNTGGWDGWISLSCTNDGVCATSNYGVGVNLSTCKWSGASGRDGDYAWGGADMGWVSFSQSSGGYGGVSGCAGADTAPSLTFSANPTVVAKGDSTTLTWIGRNLSSCTASNDQGTAFTGSMPINSSFTDPDLEKDTTYTLTCTPQDSSYATVVRSVDVKVTGGGGGTGPGATPPDIVTFSHNAVCKLSWNVNNYTSCDLYQNSTKILTFTPSDPTTYNPGSPDAQTTYTLNCYNGDPDTLVQKTTTCNPFSEVQK